MLTIKNTMIFNVKIIIISIYYRVIWEAKNNKHIAEQCQTIGDNKLFYQHVKFINQSTIMPNERKRNIQNQIKPMMTIHIVWVISSLPFDCFTCTIVPKIHISISSQIIWLCQWLISTWCLKIAWNSEKCSD